MYTGGKDTQHYAMYLSNRLTGTCKLALFNKE